MPDPQSPAANDTTVPDLIRQEAKKAGIPLSLALAVAEQESSFNPTAIGPKLKDGTQAVGTFQIIPSTAQKLGVDPHDPVQNIQGGVKYLRQLMDQYNGDTTSVLRSYGGISQSTIPYVQQVMARVKKYSGEDVDAGTLQGRPSVPAGAVASPAAAVPPAPPAATPVSVPLPTGGRAAGAGPRGAGGPAGVGPSEATKAAGATLPSGTPLDLAQAAWRGVNPMTPEGRVNDISMLASGATAALTRGMPVGPLVTRIVQTLGPAAAAAIAGGTTTAVENQLGTSTADPIEQGALQGAYEIGGRLFMWPLQVAGRNWAGRRLAGDVVTGLKNEAADAMTKGAAAVDSVRQQVNAATAMLKRTYQGLTDATAEDATMATRAAQRAAGERTAAVETRPAAEIATAKQRMAEHVADVEVANADVIAGTRKALDDLAQPYTKGATVKVQATLDGPTKRALDLAGQRVSQAAQDATRAGVTIDLKPIQDKIVEMANAQRPEILFGKAEAAKPIGFGNPTAEAFKQKMIAAIKTTGPARAAAIEDVNAATAKLFGIKPEQMDPRLPGVLGKLLGITEEATAPGALGSGKSLAISFEEAHQIKTVLDEAVNWDRTAKKQLERMTKGVRSTLRDAMSGYKPYDDATAAYRAVVPLYRKGVGQRLINLAHTPGGADQVATLLSEKKPESAAVLRQLLIDQSAAGGDARMGQEAWDLLRSIHTTRELVTPGIDKLAGNLADLTNNHPEFARTVYGDFSGQTILLNLGKIADAYATAQAQTAAHLAATKAFAADVVGDVTKEAAAKVAGAKAIGRAGVTEAGDIGRAATTAVKRTGQDEVAKATATGQAQVATAESAAEAAKKSVADKITAFKQSSLGPLTRRSETDMLADIGRVAIMPGINTKGTAMSLIRLLRAPKGVDLLNWAKYSSANTQRLVTALTSPVPPEALAAIIREASTTNDLLGTTPDQPTHQPTQMPATGAATGGRIAAR